MRKYLIAGIGAAALCCTALPSFATVPKKAPRIANPAPVAGLSRSVMPVTATTSVGAGQAGYVHYFILTHADGSLEYQLGIELDDQRIAWSFPGVGVSVSPFMSAGEIEMGGKKLGIQHLFGIRPFPDAARMHLLQKELTSRIVGYIDDETPYCVFRTPSEPHCLSCGDFVLRVLFPGRTALSTSLPRDFGNTATGGGSNTDDVLLYLLGLVDLPSRAARLKRINELNLPKTL